VLITQYTAGETERYERNVVDILVDNVGRLLRAEAALRNQIVCGPPDGIVCVVRRLEYFLGRSRP